MRPMGHDTRSYYRKHQTDTDVSEDGSAMPEYSVDGPYRLAFVPVSETRTFGEEGYTREGSSWLVIIDKCRAFCPGDILTSDAEGEIELYRVETVKTFPGEQQMGVRAL